ncbi:MAG: nucleoside-diphosphate sugar epimerase/dehydratase [Caldilineaceae bacterium]
MKSAYAPPSRYLVAQLLLSLRNRHFLFIDLLFLTVTPLLALLLRTESLESVVAFVPALQVYFCLSFLIRFSLLYQAGAYRQYWRFAGVREVTGLLQALVWSAVALILFSFLLDQLLPVYNLPRSLPWIDALLLLPCVIGSRTLIRLTEFWRMRPHEAQSHVQVVVIGAGETGSLIVREMLRMPELGLHPVALLDDDPFKQQIYLHGVPVVGGRHALRGLLERQAIDRVVIAMPSAPGKVISEIVKECRELEIPVQTLPGLNELLTGGISISRLRNVQIEDLLRREPITTDALAIQKLVTGKRVLVTGGGGSIGSELCRQLLRCAPRQLVILGHGENSVFEIQQELRRTQNELKRQNQPGASSEIVTVIADLRFGERVMKALKQYKPELVFHAAAHKHVPLMEANPTEAITNNVLGTQNLLRAAQAVGVQRFVMISTDKAVNPTSVMGASKRVAEFLVHRAAKESQRPYMVVRFGNVLGSRGSVVHTFRQQIAGGGPVTVTDPEMKRFFMTIPEAVQLVLQASVHGKGGEVFMLDMGAPVKIVDLARNLIELSGLQVGRDIEIEFSGLRPGEKLFEEMFTSNEHYAPTAHPKVLMAANASRFVPQGLEESIASLVASAERNDEEGVVRGLCALLPEYAPDPALLRSKGLAASEARNGTASTQPNGVPMNGVYVPPALANGLRPVIGQ